MPDKTLEKEEKNLNWEEEYAKAEAQGKEKVTNNDLYVEDEYYNKYVKDRYDELSGSSSNVDLTSSKEFKDYELFLNISEELGAKPLVILMPVNGIYYDHLGITKDKREEFYSKVQELAEAKGFTVLNLQDKEYEKYYLTDVMHLGWKGWLNVNEEISKYFSER